MMKGIWHHTRGYHTIFKTFEGEVEALELDIKNLIMLTHLFDVRLSALLVCGRINGELSETCHLFHFISK